MRLLSNVPGLKPFKPLVTTGFNGLDGLTFKPDHLPVKPRSWSGLRLKPDHRDHQEPWARFLAPFISDRPFGVQLPHLRSLDRHLSSVPRFHQMDKPPTIMAGSRWKASVSPATEALLYRAMKYVDVFSPSVSVTRIDARHFSMRK